MYQLTEALREFIEQEGKAPFDSYDACDVRVSRILSRLRNIMADAAPPLQMPDPAPVPMILTCPSCKVRHIDEDAFATKPHHTHACQSCGMVWRPAKVDTVGVHFLPGYGPN